MIFDIDSAFIGALFGVVLTFFALWCNGFFDKDKVVR